MIMKERLRSIFAGRAASYALNADHDAHLTEALINYLKTNKMPNLFDNRLHLFIDYAKDQANSRFALLCISYTLAEINGRMDILLSRLYQSWSNTVIPLETEYYDNPSPLPFPFWTSWILPLGRRTRGLEQFAREHKIKLKGVDKKEFLESIKLVQKVNIGHNLHTAEAIEKDSSSPKVKRLYELSQSVKYPKVFLNAAKHTQHAAIFWDRLYILLLSIAIKCNSIVIPARAGIKKLIP